MTYPHPGTEHPVCLVWPSLVGTIAGRRPPKKGSPGTGIALTVPGRPTVAFRGA